MDNIMIDIETMSTFPDAAIVSIGAVLFNIETGETGKEFYEKVSLKSSIDNGFRVDADTIFWWFNKSKEAQQDLLSGTNSIGLVLYELWGMIQQYDNVKVWSNGAGFDLPILRHAFRECGIDIPWKPYNERCVRTISALAPQFKKEATENGCVSHIAVDDCYLQIKYLVKTMNNLKISSL